MQYEVVFSTSRWCNDAIEKVLADLKTKVQDYSRRGWRPQGGVFIVHTGYEFAAYQAMVKGQ